MSFVDSACIFRSSVGGRHASWKRSGWIMRKGIDEPRDVVIIKDAQKFVSIIHVHIFRIQNILQYFIALQLNPTIFSCAT